ncbi:MAG: methylenetetrahydrofolate reductase [Arachnia sp.]
MQSSTIAQVLAEATGPTLSFEFFPPRDDAEEATLWRTTATLGRFGPDFMSVTYGANGSTRERTLALTGRLAADRTGPLTVGHLTAVSQTRAEIVRAVEGYREAGIGNILAIRGDMPGGAQQPWQRHPEGVANATELVELVKAAGDFCVGVAAFPNPHQPGADPALDAQILADKAAAGADFAVTQLFFDSRSYVELVDRVRALGCQIPIIAGIMPLTGIRQIERFESLTGAPLPADFVAELRGVAQEPERVRALGIERAVRLCREVLEAGAPGLQFFTMNRARITREVIAQLSWGAQSR